MAKRARIVSKEDGTVEASGSKYNGKYLLGNLHRRRTDRGKVVWRCATRIEKGKEKCPNSPTLEEEWIKKILGEMVCKGDIYDESVIKKELIRSGFSKIIF